MWIIGNERGINGAASMLYEDKLHELAEQMGRGMRTAGDTFFTHNIIHPFDLELVLSWDIGCFKGCFL